MKIYKINESINEDGKHVCGANCKVIKYTTNEKKASDFVNENTCPMICRCMRTIEVKEE